MNVLASESYCRYQISHGSYYFSVAQWPQYCDSFEDSLGMLQAEMEGQRFSGHVQTFFALYYRPFSPCIDWPLDYDDLFKLWGYKDYANIFVNLSNGFL